MPGCPTCSEARDPSDPDHAHAPFRDGQIGGWISLGRPVRRQPGESLTRGPRRSSDCNRDVDNEGVHYEQLASVASGYFVSVGLILGVLTAVVASARSRHRHDRFAAAVRLPDGERVTFDGARRGFGDNRRVQLNALFFVGYGVWAAVLSFHGAPILGPIATLVFLELALAAYRVSTIVGNIVTDEAAAVRVAPILNEICTRATCPVPRVMLRDDTLRAAVVRRLRKRTTLVLSRSYVNGVDDQALRALLAHEVVHIVRNDLRSAKRRAWVAVLGGAVLAGASAAVVHLAGIEAMPIWIAAAVVGVMATTAALSPLNRQRELRADFEGAHLAGDPIALSRALAAAQAVSDETKIRLFGNTPWRWLLSPLSWRMPTHPPMAERIARLEAMV